MDGPRAAAAEVTYTRPGDSGQVPAVQEYTEGFTYTDPASGESDTIKITLNNTGMEWVQGWMPQKGDVITAFSTGIFDFRSSIGSGQRSVVTPVL